MSTLINLLSTTVVPGPLFICTVEVPSLAGAPCMTVEAECPNRGAIVNIQHAEWMDTSAGEPAMTALSFVTRNQGTFIAEIRAVAATFFEDAEPSAEAETEHRTTWEEIVGADTTRVLDCGRVIDLASMELALGPLSDGMLHALCTLTIDNERRSFVVVADFWDVSVPVQLATAHWSRMDKPFMSFDPTRIAFAIEQELTARIGLELRAQRAGAA